MTTSIDSLLSTNTAITSFSSADDSSSNLVMDKEDFLTLLIAQMENQDPLDPTDATEYTAQLAQYSSLEQLINMNDNVETMMNTMSSTSTSSLDTLGKDVAFYGDTFTYDGESESVDLGYTLESAAEGVTLLIQENGETVAEIDCSACDEGNHYLTWDGLKDDGSQASSGEYTVAVEASDYAGSSVSVAPIICSTVTGVDLSANVNGTIITEQGELSSSDILAVFD